VLLFAKRLKLTVAQYFCIACKWCSTQFQAA